MQSLKIIGVSILAAMVYFAAKEGLVELVEPFASRVPVAKHVAFLTAGSAHAVSYVIAFFGGIILWVRVWRLRAKLS